VHGIQPGADITYCTYIENPFKEDRDIVQSLGYQSHFGHHVLLMEVIGARFPPGETHVCTDRDMNEARYLAGGGDAAQSASFRIPEGIAFRLHPTSTLLVQTHWINPSKDVIDGQAVFNVAARPPDPSRQSAQLFAAYTTRVLLPAHGPARVTTSCTIKSDLKIFSFGGHEHEFGTHVHIERARGEAVDALYDHDWLPTFQSAPPMATFEVNAPLEFRTGDVLRVTCDYMNSTEQEIRFPREMCVAVGFFFPATADTQCADGVWIAGGGLTPANAP
jgi:hypothetical protein